MMGARFNVVCLGVPSPGQSKTPGLVAQGFLETLVIPIYSSY